jgi:hypothetical protein
VIAVIAAWLVRLGAAQRWARPIAWALLAAVLVSVGWLAWSLWISRHDQAVRSSDRNAADRAAGAAKGVRDAAFRNEQANLQEKADAAADNGASPLDAVLDQLR